MQVLHWCHKFVVVGESFCGSSDPGNLRDQLGTLGYAHYRSMHASSLQGLYSSLERERWLPLQHAPGSPCSLVISRHSNTSHG